MTWYDINWDGQTYLLDLSGAQEKTLTALGIHGFATQAQAQANPQTMNDVQAALGGAQALAGTSGSATNIPTPGGVATGAGAAAATAFSWGEFVSRLENPHLWLRVAEAVVGIAFLVIGLNHLLGNPAGKIAAAAPKVVPL